MEFPMTSTNSSVSQTHKERLKNVQPTILKSARRAWIDRELLLSFVQRDLRSRYRRSILGWAWSMISPAVTALVYTFVFVVVFQVTAPPGDPSGQKLYVVNLLAALLPWNMLQAGVFASIGALMGGSGMMQKVYFAREHLVVGAVLALVVSFFIELGVLGVLVLFTGHFVFHFLPVVVFLVFLLTLFTVGIALVFAALNIRFRDVQHIAGVLFLVWFYITPIIYPVGLIPERYSIFGVSLPIRSILMLNPTARFSQVFRNIFFDVRLPGLGTLLGLTAISVLTFLAGYRFFIRRSPWFVEEL
jgi:ABC-type polysaccharide/polyol phosphate export permease